MGKLATLSNHPRTEVDSSKAIYAEIETEARRRKANDPELLRLEREMRAAWGQVAGATKDQKGLLNYIEQLSFINADPPTGMRRSTRHVKKLVRKLVRWYFQHLVDQLNALLRFQGRLLRGLDKRIMKLESDTSSVSMASELVPTVVDAEPALCELLVKTLQPVSGPIAVVSCGNASLVEALDGVTVHGLERSTVLLDSGLHAGRAPNVSATFGRLNVLNDSELGAVVFTSVVEKYQLVDLLTLLNQALRTTAAGGMIVVAVADPAKRTVPEDELLRGCGLAPQTWAYLFEKHGCEVELLELKGSRVQSVVVARLS